MHALYATVVTGALSLTLAGCAVPPMTDPATSGNHPANAEAPGTPFPPPSQTLAIAPSATTLPADRHEDAGPGIAPPPVPGGMDMKGMKGMKMDGMDMNGMNHMQDKPAPATAATTQASASYTCPMHPEVHADKPGNCPICGMKLVKKTGEGSQP